MLVDIYSNPVLNVVPAEYGNEVPTCAFFDTNDLKGACSLTTQCSKLLERMQKDDPKYLT